VQEKRSRVKPPPVLAILFLRPTYARQRVPWARGILLSKFYFSVWGLLASNVLYGTQPTKSSLVAFCRTSTKSRLWSHRRALESLKRSTLCVTTKPGC
jgi:hypothetical protein